MKVRIKCVVERTLDIDESSYDDKSTENVLAAEKDQFDETLQLILNDPETKRICTLTVLDQNGVPMSERHWED